MSTRAEFIGAGPLWDGRSVPGTIPEHPAPFPRGLAMGQHLAVERLVRITEDRMVYLVNNLGRKWARKKCWACGNIYSPDKARHCSYCGQRLEDVRFLMTQRWNRDLFEGFDAFARTRTRHPGLIPPVYAFYRDNSLQSVYHYDGGGLLVDMVAPLPATILLQMGIRLAECLAYLHQQGIVLRPFGAAQVVLMPDLTARWFDLDVIRLDQGPLALLRDPSQPMLRDTKNLAALLAAFVSPEDTELGSYFRKVASGLFPGPLPFVETTRRIFKDRTSSAPDPKTITHAAAYSDIGLHRAVNEDVWTWRRVGERALAYVVADGMGGHAWGDVASRLAATTFIETVSTELPAGKVEPKSIEKVLSNAMMAANEAVLARRKTERVEMGTTLTAMLVVDDRFVFVVHGGDSRAYLLRDGDLSRITRDHTVAEALVEDGQITAEQAKTHRSAHILTTTIGGEEELEFDFHQMTARPDDRFLLCSDGLYNEVPDEEITRHLLLWADRQKTVRELVRAAYHAGARDNVTALVVDVA